MSSCSPFLSLGSRLFDLQDMTEGVLGWILGQGPETLAVASTSCLLERSLLGPNHHTVRVCRVSAQANQEGNRGRGTKAPSLTAGDSAAAWRKRHLRRDPPGPRHCLGVSCVRWTWGLHATLSLDHRPVSRIKAWRYLSQEALGQFVKQKWLTGISR